MSKCTYCQLIEKKNNMLFENEKIFVMLSPEPVALGHVLVLPKAHAPVIEAVPDFVVGEMFNVANKVGVAVFEGLGAHGTNILVQNGPTAGQTQNHTMINVIPRFENDNAKLDWTPKPSNDDDLSTMEGKIKDEAKGVGSFEREKPKPVELEKPKELKEEDQRLKALRRIP